jgi:hypothetical protein
MQQVQHIETLPEAPLAASETFFADHLPHAKALIAEKACSALAIIVPGADPDHDDWRRGVVRDLARQYAPKRVNMVGGDSAAANEAMLAYLRNAPGVTGQYLAAHE